jgi:hypothetical protein
MGMASDGRSVWVLGRTAAAGRLLLVRVEASTSSVTDVFEVGSVRWGHPVLTPAATRGSAWLPSGTGSVYRFRPGANEADQVTFAEPDGTSLAVPLEERVEAADGSLWLAAFPLGGPCCDPDLYRVDPLTGSAIAHLEDAVQIVAAGAAFAWALGENVLGNRPELIRVDTETNATAPIGVLRFLWVDLTVAGRAVWASSPEDATIVRLDPVSGEETGRIRVGRAPAALAAGGGAVWAALPGAGTVIRYDLETGRRQRIEVGGIPGDLAFARGSTWVAVRPLTTEEWIGRAGAICSAANAKFEAAVSQLDLDGAEWNLGVMQAFHEAAAGFSDEALAELRALPQPPDRVWADEFYSLLEQTIDVLRQVAVAAAAGDAERVEELSSERVDLTHRKDGRFGPGLWGCPVSLPA